MNKILISILLGILLLPVFTISADSYEIDELEQFQNWADYHGITLVGVNKNSYDLYYEGYNNQTNFVDWKEIPDVLIAADSLYKIPENVIKVMDGKTIYFSTEYGRSYTVLDSFSEYGILEGLNRGIILEQNINAHTVIHEIGHIVDYHGIQGIYDDDQNIFVTSLNVRNIIFNVTSTQETYSFNIVPKGHISAYSVVNDAENFAENFAYYVISPNEFRDRIDSDLLLIDEYQFMRDNIFSSFEF